MPCFHCALNCSVLGLTSWGSKDILTKLQPKGELFNCHWGKHMSQSFFDILAQSLIQFFVQQTQQCPLQAYFSDVNTCQEQSLWAECCTSQKCNNDHTNPPEDCTQTMLWTSMWLWNTTEIIILISLISSSSEYKTNFELLQKQEERYLRKSYSVSQHCHHHSIWAPEK